MFCLENWGLGLMGPLAMPLFHVFLSLLFLFSCYESACVSRPILCECGREKKALAMSYTVWINVWSQPPGSPVATRQFVLSLSSLCSLWSWHYINLRRCDDDAVQTVCSECYGPRHLLWLPSSRACTSMQYIIKHFPSQPAKALCPSVYGQRSADHPPGSADRWNCRVNGSRRKTYGNLLRRCISQYCYTSTQNTCTRSVQIASRDIDKYAMLPARATLSGQHWIRHSFLFKFFLFKIFVFILRYNKTNDDWHHRSSLKIVCLWFVKCCHRPSASRKHFTNIWQKIFNDDLNASHYLHTVTFCLKI